MLSYKILKLKRGGNKFPPLFNYHPGVFRLSEFRFP